MESNPAIDKDVEHIPVKSASRRKLWLLFLVIATPIVIAAVITTAVLLASKDNESNMYTDAPKAFATDSFKTTGIRTTNYHHPTVSTTGNTAASNVSTFSNNTLHSRAPLTAISSTKTNTSFLLTTSQSIPFSSTTSSKQNSIATISPTSLYTTSGNDKAASSVSLTQSYPPNSTTFNLTRATTPLHLNATHYQTNEAYPKTSGTQSWNTTFFTGSTNTSVPFTYVPSSTSASNTPSSLNNISQSSTLFYTTFFTRNITTFPLPKQLLSSTSINTGTTKSRSSNTITAGTNPVHTISGHTTTTTNTIQSAKGQLYTIFVIKIIQHRS